MKLAYAIEMGAICGLTTVKEAVQNADIHAMNMYPYAKIEAELSELYKEYDEHVAAGKPDAIPQDVIDRINKELEENICSFNQSSE